MSLLRTVYLGAIFCGWMAFAGWFMAEVVRQGVNRSAAAAAVPGGGETAETAPRVLGSESLGKLLSNEKYQTIAGFLLVGAAIGAGLGLAGGLSNPQPGAQLLRMLRGLVAGSLGGAAGGWLGSVIYQSFTAA